MKKINTYIEKHAVILSVVFISLSIIVNVVACIGGIISNASSITLLISTLVFEVLLHVFLIIGLLKKNVALSNIFMTFIKLFDAVIFTISIATRIDLAISNPEYAKTLSSINFISYALSTLFLIIILVFFIANVVSNKHVFWVIVKVCLLLNALTMLICSGFEIYNLVNYTSEWYKFIEPLYMVFLMLGMFIICHYIEKER